MPTITLLTDFGTQDGYVGAMKGVLLSAAPSAYLVDLTHDVAPQDIVGGAFALEQAAPRFPAGTIHVAVVDPGVGSSRRPIAIEHGGQLYIGPDNGLLSLAAPATEAYVIDRLPRDWHVHPTFHGRDLFARVAGQVAAGARVADFASDRVRPRHIALPPVDESNGDRFGEVIHVDRFGNLVTNLRPQDGDDPAHRVLEIVGAQATWQRTYADVEAGRLVAYVGSAGYLELAVRDGNAATFLNAKRGARVRLHRRA